MDNKNYFFHKLTPTLDVNLTIYDDAFNFIFDNEDIKNVAISGAYCAGKSSVIETYKSKHPEIKFLHISLAHFETTQTSGNNEFIYNEATIEGKILNQLTHQIDSDKIPQTRFRVKRVVNRAITILQSLIILLFLILACHMIFFKSWCQFVSSISSVSLQSFVLWTTSSECLLISGLVCTILLGFIIYFVTKIQKERNIFRKFKLPGVDIEIFEQSEESFFDKYLNEVLYLFENSGAKVIVFEDMDRYNVNLIFEKLREINTLVNNKAKAKIKFFYLMRDDIFVSKDRTKFFDFIIPIIPVIDSSNSYDQFLEHFNQGNRIAVFNKDFLQGLSLYIDDMRILKNIYNEFVIYHGRLNSTELKSDKLLAIIAYKNVFPRDFSDLQLGKGFVHTLFEKKMTFVQIEIDKISQQIDKITKDIRQIENSILNSIDELDSVYLLLSKYSIQSIGNKDVSSFTTRAQFIKAIKEASYVIYDSSPYQRGNRNIKSDFDALMQNTEYIQRRQSIELKCNNQIVMLTKEANSLEKQRLTLQGYQLNKIITKDNVNMIFSIYYVNEVGEENHFLEIKGSPYFPLIKYLIRNGYIDETYPDYMTYFYEKSISTIDKIFLRSITDESAKEYTYELKDPQLVLSRLSKSDFDKEEILNYNLLNYLLSAGQDTSQCLELFINMLAKGKHNKFIVQYLETQPRVDKFIESINHLHPEFLMSVLAKNDFNDEQKKLFILYTLYYSSDDDIKILNSNGVLEKNISLDDSFLIIKEPKIEKIISRFQLIGVCFVNIDFKSGNQQLLDEVYRNNMYQLTYENISEVLRNKYKLGDSEDNYKSKNYTLISHLSVEPIASYINCNINDYIVEILDNCDDEVGINDEESSALSIINNLEISIENKKSYIHLLQTQIKNIKDVIQKDLWIELLNENRVICSETNILAYFVFSANKLDSCLVRFINDGQNELEFDYAAIKDKVDSCTIFDLFVAIANCMELQNAIYKNILSSINQVLTSLANTQLDSDKLTILISLGMIQMNTETLNSFRNDYPPHLRSFIFKNISGYIEIINIDNFKIDEMLMVLEERFADEHKIYLLQYTGTPISIQNKGYSDTVKIHILQNNLNVSDIPYLLKIYHEEGSSVKKVIKDISIEYIIEIIAESYHVPDQLLSELLIDERLEMEIKKELLLISLPSMRISNAEKYLQLLNMIEFTSLFHKKRPKIEASSINEKILKVFYEKHWISKYEVDKDEPSYYRAYGRSSRYVANK